MTCIGHENTMHMILENFILFLKMQSTCTCYCLPQIWAMMMMIIITTIMIIIIIIIIGNY